MTTERIDSFALDLVEGLRRRLDAVLVGQEQAKLAVLIGVLAREHVLLEGAPGCGKSLLAEAGLGAMGADVHLCSFHRDTRREDLLGEVNLHRRVHGNSERLSFDLEPGRMLKAQLVVLDNLGRAPGEALAPLLQLLGSRVVDLGRGGMMRLPLETAVATMALPGGEVGHEGVAVDPLEPSQLDRFALQVRMEGLVTARRWGLCRAVLDSSLERAEPGVRLAELNAAERLRLQDWVTRIPYPEDVQASVRETVLALAARVRAATRGGDGRALLSDRVFGAVLPKVLRAHAAVRGAAVVGVEDLRVLRVMVAQRLPQGLLDVLEEVLHEAIAVPSPESMSTSEEGDQGLPMTADGANEQVMTDALPGQVPGAPTTEAELPEAPALPPRRRKPRPADVEPLIKAFEGRLDRGRSDLDDDPGGQPRGFRPLRRFDELIDADPLDALLLVDGTLAGPPRVLRRRRRTLGGAVVIARDVSSSMAGFRNDWASELICGLVRAAARRRMRVGYLEFHQRAIPRILGGRLLHRRYEQLNQLVREARPMGQTNYEAPLRMALDALRGRRGANRHVVMLTDGLPILGDTQVRAERALAKKLGVSLHTVFVGDGASPPVLDSISHETSGLRFQAIERSGSLVLSERGALPGAPGAPGAPGSPGDVAEATMVAAPA